MEVAWLPARWFYHWAPTRKLSSGDKGEIRVSNVANRGSTSGDITDLIAWQTTARSGWPHANSRRPEVIGRHIMRTLHFSVQNIQHNRRCSRFSAP